MKLGMSLLYAVCLCTVPFCARYVHFVPEQAKLPEIMTAPVRQVKTKEEKKAEKERAKAAAAAAAAADKAKAAKAG